jgi:hypothetical protein
MAKKKAKYSKKEKSKKLEDSIMDINLLNNDEEHNKKKLLERKKNRQKQNIIIKNEQEEKQEKTEPQPQKIEEEESIQLNEKSDISFDIELPEEKSTQINTFAQNDLEIVEDKIYNLFDFTIINEISQQNRFDDESRDENIKTADVSKLKKNN